MRDHTKEEIVDYGKAQRSRKPEYSLVPKSAFDAIAARFELGQVKHGPKAWNALADNRESAITREWAVAAMNHVIHHATLAIQKVSGIIPDDGDDDGGAIMFGGAVLVEYNRLVPSRQSGKTKLKTAKTKTRRAPRS